MFGAPRATLRIVTGTLIASTILLRAGASKPRSDTYRKLIRRSKTCSK
jgi:hypothetical protein